MTFDFSNTTPNPPRPPIIIPYGDTPYTLQLTSDGGTELMQLDAAGHTTLDAADLRR